MTADNPDQRPNSNKSMAGDSETTVARSTQLSMPETKEGYETALPSATPSVVEKSVEMETDVKEKEEIASQGDSTATEEDEQDYPKAWKLAAITLALCLSVFCMALDNTIIATAIPRITDDFKALNDVGWYGSAYLLTTCSTQLIYGKLFTYYSIKWVYLAALFIFELGSLVCALAPNSNALIIGRAVAGVGAAGIFSGAILIISCTVPLRARPTYMGFVGGMYGIASVAGPLMGGAFTDHLTWRWCFYINLPFGAVTAAFIVPFFNVKRRSVKESATWQEQLKKMDLPGTIAFLPCVICLLLALQWGGSKYEWKSGRIIALLVMTGVLAIAFLVIQWKQGDNATVPPRIVKQRSVWGSAWFGAMLGACFFVLVYFIPIWFQAIKGTTATQSGIRNLPMILGLVVVSIGCGILVTVIGYFTPFMLASSVFMAIGAGLLTTFEVDTNSPKWIGYQFIFGAGVGMGMQNSLVAVQATLPMADVPIGTALIMFSQTLGGALFISVGQNVFTNQLIKNLASAVPDLDPSIVLRVGATEIKKEIPKIFLNGVLAAYNKALSETYYVSAATAAMSIIGAVFVEWKSMKGNPNIQPGMA